MGEAEPHALRLRVGLTTSALAAQQALLAAFLEEHGLPRPLIGRAELVFEEVVMNVLHHGFAPGDTAARDAAEVVVDARAAPPDACTLVFEDPGLPFDPTAAALPEPARRLEEAQIGGLGVPLIRKLASALAYQRLEPEGRNRLTITLRTPPARPG
jgi:anti-sigma regulatory factor (Ser/Thr protein kinase)